MKTAFLTYRIVVGSIYLVFIGIAYCTLCVWLSLPFSSTIRGWMVNRIQYSPIAASPVSRLLMTLPPGVAFSILLGVYGIICLVFINQGKRGVSLS